MIAKLKTVIYRKIKYQEYEYKLKLYRASDQQEKYGIFEAVIAIGLA